MGNNLPTVAAETDGEQRGSSTAIKTHCSQALYVYSSAPKSVFWATVPYQDRIHRKPDFKKGISNFGSKAV